jgi:sulfate adenylyltransferase subunit 1
MAAPNFELNTASFAASSLAAANQNLLRFTTAGSVDDGKSTLIGRLLYDSQAVYEDQLAAVKKSRINRSTGAIDFSLLTDGLRAEREQGITIDVAYRYFSTPRRKFIIADTPGHEQYTRNMATGASTADAAIVLIDATKGVLAQSRRHAYIASLLGIRHVIGAVNKMDLVGYSEEVFQRIARDFEELAQKLGVDDPYLIPISALEGDNVVRRSSRMAWFEGPALLEYLEALEITSDREDSGVRFPVQYVIRPDANFRGFAGTVASGTLRVGEPVVALPSGIKSEIKSIVTYDGELDEAQPGDAVTVTLQDEVDISRGDMLVAAENQPQVGRRFEAKLVWMSPEALDPKRLYLLKHTSRLVRAHVRRIAYRVDVNSFDHHSADALAMNDIAQVEIETTLPLFFDPYSTLRATGSFILVDPISNATVGAGMIEGHVEQFEEHRDAEGRKSTRVTAQERQQKFGHASAAIAIHQDQDKAEQIERTLFDEGWNAVFIDATNASDSELRAVAVTLQAAGIVGIFRLEQAQLHLLTEVFGSNVFDGANDDVISRLRAWREGDIQ